MARILVVEDDEDIRNVVDRQLRKGGHKVATADSVRAARQLIEEKGMPEVLVLDVGLPDETGLEFLRSLRDDPATTHLPVVMLSARVQPSDVQAGRDLGAVYLTKPFVASALLGAIERARNEDDAGTW